MTDPLRCIECGAEAQIGDALFGQKCHTCGAILILTEGGPRADAFTITPDATDPAQAPLFPELEDPPRA